MKKDDLKLSAGEKRLLTKFKTKYSSINKENPSQVDRKELNKLLNSEKTLVFTLQKCSKAVVDSLISRIGEFGQFGDGLKMGVEEMKNELGYGDSSALEQLLMDNIILEFLRMEYLQLVLTETDFDPKKGKEHYWDQRVTAAQKRFIRATEALIRIRKSKINLQINVAAEGGKQINLQK